MAWTNSRGLVITLAVYHRSPEHSGRGGHKHQRGGAALERDPAHRHAPQCDGDRIPGLESAKELLEERKVDALLRMDFSVREDGLAGEEEEELAVLRGDQIGVDFVGLWR